MINSVDIVNFRSIQKATISLKPLTVVVGANSTGKSNLIKALDFISDIAEYGLQDAIDKRGGFKEILPKQINGIQGKEIYFKLDMTLEPPDNWPVEFGELKAIYELRIKNDRERIKIVKEVLTMKSILLLAYFLENKWDTNTNTIDFDYKKIEQLLSSEFVFDRKPNGNIQHIINFPRNDENNVLMLAWLGIKNILNEENLKLKSNTSIDKVIGFFINNVRAGLKSKDVPIISFGRTLFGFSPHLRTLITELRSIARYDLMINELRQEQPLSNSHGVSITGDNVPSVVKKFIKNNKEAWKRISTTMSNISPYFSEVYCQSLRAGKEYIVFKEIFKGRLIESWEASDGTLRALAILLSLESHNTGSTILIEEPEHGLHPWAVKDLIEHIKEVIKKNNLQVIITTHSQQVLESIDKDELLITDRSEKGTTYSTIDDIVPDADVSMGEIGELWTRGLLKGVPVSY